MALFGLGGSGWRVLAAGMLLLAGCAGRHVRGAKLRFEERFGCRPETVHEEGERWVITGCRHRAEYECGFRAGHSGDRGYANCHLRALSRPSPARTFARGVRVESGADGHSVVRARTGRSSPRIELRASPASAPDVAEWLVSAEATNGACTDPPRVWIDGFELTIQAHVPAAEGRLQRFQTPLSPLARSAEARRVRVDVCDQRLVLAKAEREVLSDFAVRAAEVR